MACVVKVQNLEENTTLGELRRTFKEHGARPADIHITPSNNSGKPRIGFAAFRDRKEADIALRVDGAVCRDCRIIVKPSSPKEFDRHFPGKPMLTSQDDNIGINYNKSKGDHQRNHEDARHFSDPGVIIVDNIDLSANPSDIRKFFKDHDARPADIHLVQGNTGKHDGSAFLVFNQENEASNALGLHGSVFFKKRLSIKLSSPKEFDRHFPRVAMLSSKPMGNRGGQGRGRGGMKNGGGRNISPPTLDTERGRASTMRGGHGGGRGGAFGPKQQGRSDQFFGGRGGEGEKTGNGRARSRSPINRRRDSNPNGNEFNRRRSNPNPNPEPMGPINDLKFLRISGLPYNASQVDIQEFLRPILTRDIYIIRNVGGKYAGKFNGSALIEFFSDGDARQAMKMNGTKFGNNRVQVVQASKEEIARTIQENKFSGDVAPPPAPPLPDASALNAIAQSNPQVQQLLTLLTATVNTIAGAAAAAVQPKPESRATRGPRGGSARGGDRVDPVINRVASSANIDVSDIKQGRVVGLRNLPYTVTTDDILHFFRNHKVVPDSVRIHQLDDGRCSGDAIVSFRGNRDARNAVSELNKGSLGRRKVELFFL